MKKAFYLLVLVAALSLVGCDNWWEDSPTEPLTTNLDVRVAGFCTQGIIGGDFKTTIVCTDDTTLVGGDPDDVISVQWEAQSAAGLAIGSVTGGLGERATIFNVQCAVGSVQVQQTVQLRLRDGSIGEFSRGAPHILQISCL